MKHNCPKCGEIFYSEDPNDIICPKCGYRQITVELHHTITERSDISISFKSIDKQVSGHKKRKRYLFDGFDRIENSHLYKRRVRRYQRIDRLSGTGIEIIKDLENNKVLYSKEYKLKDHSGHGSDKANMNKTITKSK